MLPPVVAYIPRPPRSIGVETVAGNRLLFQNV
jgi:hypothetical protein